jgi:hypothetical protein
VARRQWGGATQPFNGNTEVDSGNEPVDPVDGGGDDGGGDDGGDGSSDADTGAAGDCSSAAVTAIATTEKR